MGLKVREIVDKKEEEEISREVLYDLPEWFGIPKSTEAYIADSQDMPFLASFADGECAGFVVLNATSKDCADIYAIGIKKKIHRMGVGTMLHEAYEDMARERG